MSEEESAVDMRRIVCLANSRKPDGRCLAGKVTESGAWLRPVSARSGGSVSEDERRYEDGRDPRLLDVLDVPLICPKPSVRQPENWLLDPDWYWELVDRFAVEDLPKLLDHPNELWTNGHSTVAGRNDRVPEASLRLHSGSLLFVDAQSLMVRVLQPGAAQGDAKRKVRGAFSYLGVSYDFTITDPIVERAFLAGPDGEFELGDRYLTLSLAEPYNGFGYKLIAAVLDLP